MQEILLGTAITCVMSAAGIALWAVKGKFVDFVAILTLTMLFFGAMWALGTLAEIGWHLAH